eukprot:7566463-Heterocapsa_arctica.AAC.1
MLPLGAQNSEFNRVRQVRNVAHRGQDAQERYNALEAEFPLVPVVIFFENSGGLATPLRSTSLECQTSQSGTWPPNSG